MLHTEITETIPAQGAPKAVLTPREIEVLRLLAEGMSSKDVAMQLRISFKTATSHRSNILAKLRVHDTVLAVRWAIRERIIEA